MIGGDLRRAARRAATAALAAAAAAALLACNNVGDCPAATDIVPGGSCSGDSLECPFTLQALDPACDGTMAEGGIMTSCVCTKGTWQCPSVTCPGASGDDGGGAGDDGGGQPGSDASGE